jgi:hypothetical protein
MNLDNRWPAALTYRQTSADRSPVAVHVPNRGLCSDAGDVSASYDRSMESSRYGYTLVPTTRWRVHQSRVANLVGSPETTTVALRQDSVSCGPRPLFLLFLTTAFRLIGANRNGLLTHPRAGCDMTTDGH